MANNAPMTKNQLVTCLAEEVGLKKDDVKQLLDKLAEVAYEQARDCDKGFTLPGFGKLLLKEQAERMGRNPSTGETIQIPAKKVVKFRIAKAAKDAILG